MIVAVALAVGLLDYEGTIELSLIEEIAAILGACLLVVLTGWATSSQSHGSEASPANAPTGIDSSVGVAAAVPAPVAVQTIVPEPEPAVEPDVEREPQPEAQPESEPESGPGHR